MIKIKVILKIIKRIKKMSNYDKLFIIVFLGLILCLVLALR